MKKIFILTGEPSGDKLAAEVIKELNKSEIDIEYLSVGGQHLNSIGIKSIYDQKDITYIAFTDILFNIFKIKRKINEEFKSLLNPLKKEVRTHTVRLKDEAKKSVIAIRIGPSQIPIKSPN